MMKLSRRDSPKISLLSSLHAWSLPTPGRCHQRERPSALRVKRVIAESESAIVPSGRSSEKLCTASVCISPYRLIHFLRVFNEVGGSREPESKLEAYV